VPALKCVTTHVATGETARDMAKKKRKKKRSAKTPRRRRLSAKQEIPAFQPGAFQQSAFQTAPTRAVWDDQGNFVGNAAIQTAPTPIVPVELTVYPDDPQGQLVVQNYVTINIQSRDFKQFEKTLADLVGELRRSNEIAGEIRDKLVSEMQAGREVIAGPKPQRSLIDLFLKRPLQWLAEKAGSAVISKLATEAFDLLMKLIS
jgi:hypothetical protein